jgi:hypothetical protein
VHHVGLIILTDYWLIEKEAAISRPSYSPTARDTAISTYRGKQNRIFLMKGKAARIKRNKRELDTELKSVRYETGPTVHLIGPIGLQSSKAIVRSKATLIQVNYKTYLISMTFKKRMNSSYFRQKKLQV